MFEPTIKQLDALARMEDYIDIGSHRTHFPDKKQFEEYWQRVSDRCDAKTRARKAAEGKESRPPSFKQRQKKTFAWYNNQDRLLAYAEKYQKRYQPSREKLRQQLIFKCNNPDLSATIIEALADRIDDQALALSQAVSMQHKGKNISYIKQKLRQRCFDQDCVAQTIDALKQEDGSVLDEDALEKQVLRLHRKGMSRRAIQQRLCEQAADRAPVNAALDRLCDDDEERANLQRQIAKLEKKSLDRNKLIQRLLSKGFSYDSIQNELGGTSSSSD